MVYPAVTELLWQWRRRIDKKELGVKLTTKTELAMVGEFWKKLIDVDLITICQHWWRKIEKNHQMKKINDGEEKTSFYCSYVFNQKGQNSPLMSFLLQEIWVYSCKGSFLILVQARYIQQIDSNFYEGRMWNR